MVQKQTHFFRVGTEKDATQILDIYATYVEKTAISFDYITPSLEDIKKNIKHTLQKYPYIVAESNGEILGYAYTHAFIHRTAYDWSAEITIYLKPQMTQKGLGKQFYTILENISKEQHIYNLNACIGYPEIEDDYLTQNSVQFHKHIGYRFIGKFHNAGYKFNTWYHMVWMEKILQPHPKYPPKVIPFSSLDKRTLEKIGLTFDN